MPTPKDGESEKDFVSRCIPIVMKDGTAKDNKQASAICYSMYKNKDKKSISSKIGARNNATDKQSIQSIHDNAKALGAECSMDMNEGITAMLNGKSIKNMMEMGGLAYARQECWDIQACCNACSQIASMCQSEMLEPDHLTQLCNVLRQLCQYMMEEIDEMEGAAKEEGTEPEYNYAMMSKAPAQVKDANEGDTNTLNLSYIKSILNADFLVKPERWVVKYVSKNVIAHPVFIWGDEKKTDLEIEYFNKSTDFWDKQLEGFERPLTWEHGQDKKFEEFEDNPVIGKTVKYHDDAIARWAESVITTDKEYRKFIDQFIEEKRLGYSSDSAPQYVKREKAGKATWLKSWPWFGGSLTASPCEPRMKLFTPEFLKSLGIAIPDTPEEWEADMAMIDWYKTIYIK